jgi:hypothetical protein
LILLKLFHFTLILFFLHLPPEFLHFLFELPLFLQPLSLEPPLLLIHIEHPKPIFLLLPFELLLEPPLLVLEILLLPFQIGIGHPNVDLHAGVVQVDWQQDVEAVEQLD